MEDNNQLLNKLKELKSQKLAQFMWISVARMAPFFSSRFLGETNQSGYFTFLFQALETCRLLSSNSDLNSIDNHTLVRAISNTRDRDNIFLNDYINKRNIVVISESKMIKNDPYYLDNIIYRTIDYAIDISSDIVFDNGRDVVRVRRVVNDRNRSLDYFNANICEIDQILLKKTDQRSILKLLLEDAEFLRNNDNAKLENNTKWYGKEWARWITTLNKLGGGYWANWYIRLYQDSFKITDPDEVLRHLTLPKEMWKKEISVSAQWLSKLAQTGSKHLNEARIILLGEKGAGKTSLARRLIDPYAPMPEKEESTEGVDVTNVKLSDMTQEISAERDANVHIWDFAGHAITHATHRFFLSERCLYIIVYDGRTEGRNNLSYWLDHVRNFGGQSRVIVLVNLQDQHNPDIAETYFKERYADHQCTFIRFSIKDDTKKLQQFREILAKIIADDPVWDQEIPTEYYYVKEQIEKIFAKEQKNHISRQEFDLIANSIVDIERDVLLKSLTCLGVCLWYPDIKEIDLLVLNPEWITRGIYKIINWLRKSERADASITLQDFKQVFNAIEKEYSEDKHLFLYRLMQKYELAYKKAYFDQIVVPQCLPEDCPAKENLPVFPQETSLYIEITASKSGNDGSRLTFPPDVLPRFIVRRSEDLSDSVVWRYGAVFTKGNVTALINQDDYLIRIFVKGNERRIYWGELQETFRSVLSDYSSFAVEKPEVSCCIVGSDGVTKEMIPLTQIVNVVDYMEKQKITQYYDPTRQMEISINNAIIYLSPNMNDYFVTSSDVNKILERVETMLQENPRTVFNVTANQANMAPDGIITATQNNGLDVVELTRLINELKAAIPIALDEEVRDAVIENVSAIEEELKKEKPRKGVLSSLLTGLKAIKGTAEFVAAVAAIVQFIQLNF